MEHTPFGYVIVDGRPKVHETEAARLTTLYSSYLLGLSRESAAEVAGIKANHTEVKRMLQNVHYLGDDVYPRIIEDDIFNAVQAERHGLPAQLLARRAPPRDEGRGLVHLLRVARRTQQARQCADQIIHFGF